jgi:hypothetical protein
MAILLRWQKETKTGYLLQARSWASHSRDVICFCGVEL